MTCSVATCPVEFAIIDLSLRSHMFQGCIASPSLCRGNRMVVQNDMHLWLRRDNLAIERGRVCDDPLLTHFYLACVRTRCEERTRARLLVCPLQLRQRLLGCLAGYARCMNISQWCLEHHLRMLLNNESRRFPQVWIRTEMVGNLDPTVMQDVPRVTEWMRTFNAQSKPMHMFITRAQGGLLLRYERWVLRSPTQRTETVLAYRTHTDGLCSCCNRPAFWKVPRGERGCSVHILRVVAQKESLWHWKCLANMLSRSQRSPFQHLLLLSDVNSNIFEWCFCDPDCLSCSCDRCTLQEARAGVLCPADKYYMDEQLLGPESPRDHWEPLRQEDEKAAWFVAFDQAIIRLTKDTLDLPGGL